MTSTSDALPVRLVGFLLALLPALSLGAVYNGVGYFQAQLGEKSLYWKLVAVTNLAPTIAVLLTVHDKYFDETYGSWIGPLGRVVVLVRMFVPSLLLVGALAWIGRAGSGPELVAACGLAGLCGGWLNYFSSTLVAAQGGVGDLRQTYVAVACASLLCIAVYELLGFHAGASRGAFRLLMDLFGLCVLVLLAPAAWLHFGAKVDYSKLFSREAGPLLGAEDRRARSAPALLADGTHEAEVSDGGEYIQTVSSCLDLVPLPLLPVVFAPETAQALMTLRLWAEASGVALVYVLPSPLPAAARLGILVVRSVLLGVLAAGLPWASRPSLLMVLWFLFCCSGLTLGALNDLAAPKEGVKTYLRRLRVGHHVGMLLGLAVAGVLVARLDGQL